MEYLYLTLGYRNMSSESYWLGFRQTEPKPAGKVVLLGPFANHETAITERNRSKAWDCSISAPFLALNRTEALTKADMLTL